MSELEDKLNSILSSPDSMEQIMSIAKSLGVAPGGQQKQESSESPIDPKLMSMAAKLMGEYGRDDGTGALLRALKPFLREEKRKNVDRAVELTKLARIAKSAISSGGAE